MKEPNKIVKRGRRYGEHQHQWVTNISQQSNINLTELLEISQRRKWMVILPMVLFTVTATGLAFILPPYYRSTTLILVERQQVSTKYVSPTDTSTVAEKLSTIKQQIMSRTKLEQIIKEFDLIKRDALKRSTNLLIQKLSKLPGMWRFGLEKPSMEDMVEKMRKNIKVQVIGANKRTGGDAFTISYVGKHPATAMEITNAIASLFIEENLKQRELYAEGTSEFLSNELKKAKQELEGQESAFRLFKEKHMGVLPEQLDANLRTLDRLQLELQSVTDGIINAETQKNIFEEQLALKANSSTSGPVPLETELKRLKTILPYLLSSYTEKYPDVIRTKSRIKEIERIITTGGKDHQKTKDPFKLESGLKRSSNTKTSSESFEIYTKLEPLSSQLKILRNRERIIRRQIKAYEKRVEDTPANEQRLASIKRNYEMSQQNYQSLLEKNLSARLAENLEKRQKGERFRIIDPANLPEKSFKPKKLRLILLGAMAGIGFGAGLVYMIEFLNPAFRKPEDIENVLPQPVLGVIPLFPESTGKKQKMTPKVIKENKNKVV